MSSRSSSPHGGVGVCLCLLLAFGRAEAKVRDRLPGAGGSEEVVTPKLSLFQLIRLVSRTTEGQGVRSSQTVPHSSKRATLFIISNIGKMKNGRVKVVTVPVTFSNPKERYCRFGHSLIVDPSTTRTKKRAAWNESKIIRNTERGTLLGKVVPVPTIMHYCSQASWLLGTTPIDNSRSSS
jgi:hypothetical protein